MAKRRRRRRSHRLLNFLLILALCAGFFWWSNHSLQVERFTYRSPRLPAGFDGCVVVQLSDLHGAVFGEDNRELAGQVRELEPDYIFLTGDLLDRWRRTPHSYAVELGPNGYADQKTPEELAAEVGGAFGEPFWLLLAHRNNCFEDQYSHLGADLVISGHGHGGMIRLPFTDGLISVERTLFPSYTAGFYEANGGKLFVSRGLGNPGPSFRLFNRPQVVALTMERGG